MALTYNFKTETIFNEERTSPENVQTIKTWMQTTSFPDLPDKTIILFLLSCTNDIEATQKAIRNYFKIKSRAVELFKDRDIDGEGLKHGKELIIATSFPKRLDNAVIQFYRLKDTNHENFVLADAFKMFCMSIDASQQDDPPKDMIAVLDMDGIGFMHLTRIKLGVMKNFIDYVQDGMPLKIKKIHVLNTGYVAEKVVGIAKLFMNRELASALHIHSVSLPMEEFFEKWVPVTHFPKEYGGDLPSYLDLNENSLQKFREMKGFYEAEDKLIDSYEANK